MTLKEQLLKYIRSKNTWVNGGELEKYANSLGYKGSTAGRELRFLSEHDNSPLLKDEKKGERIKSIWYKPRTAPKITEYKVGGVVVYTKHEW